MQSIPRLTSPSGWYPIKGVIGAYLAATPDLGSLRLLLPLRHLGSIRHVASDEADARNFSLFTYF
jgi:hypothetical protein